MNKPIAAAGIILLQTSKHANQFNVLLLKRNPKLKVHGGNWVFPGGKVDADDYNVIKTSINILPSNIDIKNPPKVSNSDYLRLVEKTALRETWEEAGITLESEPLYYFSRWLTPKAISKRFDTCFFIAETSQTEVTVDGSEIIDYQWLTPTNALALYKKGDIAMPPATYVTLVHLKAFTAAQNAIKTLCHQPMHYKPKLIPMKDGFCSLYEEDAGYLSENYLAEGPHHRMEIRSGNVEYISSFR